MITTLLVANRGEIALRVFRTAKQMGIRTVAVHTDIDAHAPHTRAADLALPIDNYLDIDQVVAAAVRVGADAIHPGYGFLSERADLARAVEAAGIRLVGPSADVMERMGRKDAAREVARAAGVPVVPSYDVAADPTTFAYPVLVKAAAGGGGKGMRIVRDAAHFAEAVTAARREAAFAFGDDTMLVEKYVESGRHLEVQVMGDDHGNVVHYDERDCSTQRRHQKVLEEAPGPTVDPELRRRLTDAAVALAKEVGYSGAGTVEFLLDNATGDFYFLEMNTRLQVEHPVTELVHGNHDLVAEQLDVAAGGSLPAERAGDGIRGHAIEARVYAEDSFGGFLPQAGTARVVHWPGTTDPAGPRGVRVDHALESGQVVSTSYDPMLGKVIAWGRSREEARRVLLEALDETAVLGLTTNAGFLRQLLASDDFRDAAIDTAWLDSAEITPPDRSTVRLLVAHAIAEEIRSTASGAFGADGWRAGGTPAPVLVRLDDEVKVEADGDAGGLAGASRIGGHRLRTLAREGVRVEISLDGERHVLFLDQTPHRIEAVHRGQRFDLTPPDLRGETASALAEGDVVAPMPGTVLVVDVAVGDKVASGQSLGAMEAMKMELALTAPFDGVVTAVDAEVGSQVALGASLFTVEVEAAASGPGGE